MAVHDWTYADFVLTGIDEDGVRWTVETSEGWTSGPGVRLERLPRPQQDGEWRVRPNRAARDITLAGKCWAPDHAALERATRRFAGLPVEGELSGTSEGLTLTADVTLLDAPTIAHQFPTVGVWQLAVTAPDVVLRGAPVTAGTGLPVETGGLEFDLFTDSLDDTGQLEFGANGASGRVSLSNPGTAEARPVLTITGTLPNGFELIETVTGSRLRYEGPVGPGQTLMLDTATGRVRLDGADRGGLLTRREWWGIPRRGQREVLFTTLGPYAADAYLTVTSRPTYL